MNLKVDIFKITSKKLYLINHALLLCKLGSAGNKYKLFLLTIFLLINGITDTIPVILVIPFITVIGDPEKVLELPKVKEISSSFGIIDPNSLLLPFLTLFLVFVIINTYIKLYLIDFIFFVKASIANTISKSAFKRVLYSTYEYQIGTNSSKILNNFNTCMGCSTAYIETFLSMIRDFVILIFISSTLLIVNLNLTLILFVVASLTFILISSKKNKLLAKEGRIAKISSEKQINIIQEGLGSLKNIILENNQNIFLKNYSRYNRKYLFSGARTSATLTKPKYFIEGLFIAIIGIAAYFFKANLGLNPIPILGSLALGLQKLLPTINSLFINYSSMIARYELSCNTIDLLKKIPQDLKNIDNEENSLFFFKSLELKGVNYNYPSNNLLIVKNCNLNIQRGETVGIKGKTGSGKSTLINLIMCLMKPSKGIIYINGLNINEESEERNLIKWRKSIAHVPQFIFLSDTTIIENIAFGIQVEKINFERVVLACKAAKIYEFIKNSEKGFYTNVGERGIKLSGGQLQRIGIARALYRNSEILILDEATSALDPKTEAEVIDSIKRFNKNLTLISISHRLSTLVGYDRIIKFTNKKVYNEKK
tara:strand:- start:281 stop:2068 length:1788 start_codon:yes stop_codon:yes gene_type:complete